MNLYRAAMILLVGGALLAPQPAAAWTYMRHYSGHSGRYMSHYSAGGGRYGFSFYHRGRSSGYSSASYRSARGVTPYRVPRALNRSATYTLPFWLQRREMPLCGMYNRAPAACKFVTMRYEPDVALAK